jgi:hypothetical protein
MRLAVFRAKHFGVIFEFFMYRFIKCFRVYGGVADTASQQFHCNDLIPIALKKVFKFDGILGTYPPALAAAGAPCHVMRNRS